ncbi:MAG: hypothetical protein ACREN1_04255 [Candidatus Dormibacteria bacterium]
MADQESEPQASDDTDDAKGERFAIDDDSTDDVSGHHQARAFEGGDDDSSNPLSHTGRGA